MNLRRTLLITPASDEDLIRKGRTTDADMLFLDLEDAILSERKVQTRSDLVEFLGSDPGIDKSIAVRINAVTTRWWYEDLIDIVAEAGERIDSLIVPKVSRVEQLHAVDLLLRQVERNAGVEPGEIGLIPQLESATAINNATRIARSVDRLTALLFGPGDYAASIGVGQTGDGSEVRRHWEYARSRVVNAAREVGIQVIDGMYPDTGDTQGFRTACQRSRALGFDGKTVVHPNQIHIANEIFTPSPQDVRRARRIYEAYTASDHDERGTVEVDGQVIDEETFEMAKEIVEKATEADELADL
ncbi:MULTISPECIES: HpcH/HpaI aldolase/citrate lyase family protein [Haloferacaceae]|uniref:HpcH/HpaI aldolase/citrate lyase family protein n=1 Tax=Halorubrum glutamatedens TaxID=2707018 RepID=A0ABD5QQ54_9EURY|nr:CoA ester lyase [Halobellus captivus]